MLKTKLSLIVLTMLFSATAAFGVKPKQWQHRTEADFNKGSHDGTLATNLGEIVLSNAHELIAQSNDEHGIIYDMVQLADGRVCVALGADGALATLPDTKPIPDADVDAPEEDKAEGDKAKDDAKKDEKKKAEKRNINVVHQYESSQVFKLLANKNDLYIGVSTDDSYVEVRTGNKLEVTRTYKLEGVRYIWDLAIVKNTLYVSTGTEGKVYVIDLTKNNPKPEVALETSQKNILCLGIGQDGRMYAGTDGEGLVYRFNKNDAGKYDSFIMYDANEPEIGTIYVSPSEEVYVGTSDASGAKPGRMTGPAKENTGRPADDKKADDKKPADQAAQPKEEKPDPKPAPKPAQPEQPKAEEAKPEPAPKAEPKPAAKPTKEQYDKLRAEIKKRLEVAKSSGGKLEVQPAQPNQVAPAARTTRPSLSRTRSSTRSSSSGSSKGGNAIYKISKDGFVNEVFRESVMILEVTEIDGKLIIATGQEGEVYQLDLAEQEVALIAHVPGRQCTTILKIADKTLVGTANPGEIVSLSDGFASSGEYVSETLDAQQISLWGKLQLNGKASNGAKLSIQTRSGNISDPEKGPWSAWSKPVALNGNGDVTNYINVTSPPARFLQYKLILESNGKSTPHVLGVELKYLMPNMKPSIESVKVDYVPLKTSSSSGGPKTTPPPPAPITAAKLSWKAADPNDDKLLFTIKYKPFGDDQAPWVMIADDLVQPAYNWDINTVADGRYIVQVTSSDKLDNTTDQVKTDSRNSEPFLVDNTAPTFSDVKVEQVGNEIRLHAKIADNLSEITDIRYTVNSSDQWEFILPEDLIYDSTSENVVVIIPDLAPGAHAITLRASDALGNTRYLSKTVKAGNN